MGSRDMGCRITIAALLLLTAVGCSRQATPTPPAPTPPPPKNVQFEEKQVWTYRTRPGEEKSRLVIGRIESDATSGTIVHIKVVGVSVKNPGTPSGRTTELPHIPISTSALAGSVLERSDDAVSLDGFEEGYTAWKEAEGGVFMVPVSEIVGYVEKSMSEPADQPPAGPHE